MIPDGLLAAHPWWRNLFENALTVQFNHRAIAWALFVVIPLFWWKARRTDIPSAARLPLDLMLAMLGVQLTLGITTLVLQVPVALGAAHQGGALVLFALSLWTAHALRRT